MELLDNTFISSYVPQKRSYPNNRTFFLKRWFYLLFFRSRCFKPSPHLASYMENGDFFKSIAVNLGNGWVFI